MTCNGPLSMALTAAENDARESFHFFTAHVLGNYVEVDICKVVQRSVAVLPQGESILFLTDRCSILSNSLCLWLKLQGHKVVCPHTDHRVPETYHALFSAEAPAGLAEQKKFSVEPQVDGVTVERVL